MQECRSGRIMSEREEFDRTIAYGEHALDALRQNSLPAYPRYYEFWYTYAAGLNGQLNRALNEAIRDNGALSRADIDRLYVELLSPTRLSDEVESIGLQLSKELVDLNTAVRSATDEADVYGSSLGGALRALVNTKDPEAVSRIAKHLSGETSSMQAANRELQEKLADSKRQVDDLRSSLETVRMDSQTDALTGVGNRKMFDQSIATLEQNVQLDAPFSLLMGDVDYFKKFNDTYGHQTGDQVLRLVATAMKSSVKGSDIVARYGGEEFAVLLPNTRLEQAMRVAEHVRLAVMSKELIKRSTGERLGRISISIGCSMWSAGDSSGSMIERADAALYAAKRAGRNQVMSQDASGMMMPMAA